MLFLGGEHSVWQVRSFTWEAQVSSGIIVKCNPKSYASPQGQKDSKMYINEQHNHI